MDPNVIAVELLCSICKKLPIDPVVAEDGCVYEKKELDRHIEQHSGTSLRSKKIKDVIEKLVSTGEVKDCYLGHWEVYSLKKQAEAGDTRSMVRLGECLIQGNAIEKNEAEAYKWFEQASEGGDEEGTARRADCLIAGLGTKQDFEEGHQLLFEAANEEDSVPAAIRLWYYYSKGIHGYRLDNEKANKWLNRVKNTSELNDNQINQLKENTINSIYFMQKSLQMPLKGNSADNKMDWATKELDGKEKCATTVESAEGEFSTIAKNAEEGCTKSIVELGNFYLKGHGVVKDEAEAYKWYERASDKGDEEGTAMKADCVLLGFGTEKDASKNKPKKVSKLNEKQFNRINESIADSTLLDPQANNSTISREEMSVKTIFDSHFDDISAITEDGEAKKWIDDARKKAEGGDVNSMLLLGELYMEGKFVRRNSKESYKWFDLAAQNEDEVGMTHKADCLVSGFGVNQDRNEGYDILLEAVGEHKSLKAATRLWYYHDTGIFGFTKDDSRAKKWLDRAKKFSSQLDDDAFEKTKLDVISFVGKCEMLSMQQRNKADVSSMLEQAEKGETKSMTALGELYMTGKYVEKCEKEAYKWFDLASKQDDETGILRKADCLIGGKGVEQDYFEGRELLSEAATNNASVDAAVRLWFYFSTGTHQFKQDVDKAEKWLQRAKKNSPKLSNDDIEKKKIEIAELIGKQSTETEDTGQEADNRANEPDNSPQGSSNDFINSNENTGEMQHRKKCFGCGESKTLLGFSPSQWKYPVGTGRCTVCVSQIGRQNVQNSIRLDDNIFQNSLGSNESARNLKNCFECGVPKEQLDFTASQWKKRVGTGKCISCVSKCPQWSVYATDRPASSKMCAGCKIDKTHAEFTPNQWKKRVGEGRCRECV